MNLSAPPARRHVLGATWAIFAAALAVRAGYALALYAAGGAEALLGPDSHGYMAMAADFASRAHAGALAGWDWLGPDPGLMPAYLWFLFATGAASFGPLAPVLAQAVIDAGTCVLAARLAAAVDRRMAAPAGWFAVFNPTLVVMSGLVYTDTLFTFGAAAALVGAARWLRTPEVRWGALLGLGLGVAALTRILIFPWALGLILVLLPLAGRWRGIGLGDGARTLAPALALFLLMLAPVVGRNVDRYGAFQLTSQTGAHLLYWVVPLTMEARDGTPHAQGADEMSRRYARTGEATMNPFRRSAGMAAFALDRLADLGPGAIAKAWAYGAAINLFSPAMTHVPLLARLPRTGFYATPGNSKPEKIWNFLFRNQSPTYAWFLVLGTMGVLALRAVQLLGLVAARRADPERRLVVALLVLWIIYILAIDGPVAAPKYRLPLEPAFSVFFALGLDALRRWRRPARRG